MTELQAQKQPQVQSGVVNEELFQNVIGTPEKDAPHAARFQAVGKRTFQHLATAAVRVDGGLFFGLVPPASAPVVRLRDVGSNSQFMQIPQTFVAVIPLVGHQFGVP